jgi:glycosyltransferase involved in cell wall biosynthesis
MRVLHVIPSIGHDQGGLRTATMGACVAMRAAGLQPEIACLNAAEPGDPDFPIHRFKPGRKLLGASAPLRDWLLDHARDYDAIFAHVVWLNPAHYAAKAAARADVPLYLFSHGMLDPDALSHHRMRKLVRWQLGMRKLIARSVLVFSSNADRDRSLSHPELEGTNSVVAPNPVAMPQLRASPDGPIACLNRMHPRKGVLEWVNALVRMHKAGVKFRAVYAGHAEQPDYAAAVRKAAEPLGHAIEFRGAVVNAQALELTGSAAMLVHPATGFENFGNVIAEGMAAARPVVASRRALVTPELDQAGVVIGVEPTPDQLAGAMRGLLENPGAATELGRKARAYAERHFSFEAVGKRWLEILQR